MTLEISMWLIYTGILGRREIHTTACPCTCHHPIQKDLWGSWMSSTTQVNTEVGRVSFSFFYFQLKGLLKEPPVLFSSSSQCIKSWAASLHPSFVAEEGQLPPYPFLPEQVSDCRCYICQPSWETDEWNCAPETWTYNLQHAIYVASYLAGALVPGVPEIHLQIDHVMSKMKWKVIVIVDYIIRKQESECLTNGNTWNTCTKS